MRKLEIRHEKIGERDALIVITGDKISLSDTFECGQAFRYEELVKKDGYTEYMTVVGKSILFVGQREAGELIFYGISDADFENIAIPYFGLDREYDRIKETIVYATESEWLKNAAEASAGIHILKQDAWEALFSFIISQNNNIPRIRKMIKKLSAEYGENLAIKHGFTACPKGICAGAPIPEKCRECGICYSFPTAADVAAEPEKMKSSNPGFRFKYLLNAAERVHSGETKLSEIEGLNSFDEICAELKKILGVGDKVASCVALFGMARLEAFPIDVWMKRAIDDYFDGHLDHTKFGSYAGVAQQYIFHYIRNIESKD